MRRRLFLIAGVISAMTGCTRPCETLVERICGCDQSDAANRKACEQARDTAMRERAEAAARVAGHNLHNICAERLEVFKCPADGWFDYGPGKWNPGRLGDPLVPRAPAQRAARD